jgi:hypothetical protein
MGQQQLLLIVLGTILVTIAIAVGINLVRDNHEEAIGDEMQETLTQIAINARNYYLKPKELGGGGGSFIGFKFGKALSKTPNGFYAAPKINSQSLTMTGFNMQVRSKMDLTLKNENGFKVKWECEGLFANRSTNDFVKF